MQTRGIGIGRGGQGQGQGGGNKPGSGPSGYCVCPSCGYRTPHTRGVPCTAQNCPNCGKPLVKE